MPGDPRPHDHDHDHGGRHGHGGGHGAGHGGHGDHGGRSGGHGHHGHHHAMPGSDRAILWAVVVNLALTGAQIGGGLVAESTALIADGVHNLSDALALVLAYGARRLARRPASPDYSWGWGRAEVVAAFVNYLALIAVSVWLVAEAAARLADPPPVAGGLVMALAGLALVVDLGTAALVYRAARDSTNIRAAFLHNLADAAVSVAVLVGGALILAFGWARVDPALTIAISVVIVWHVLRELPPVWRMLMLAAPAGLDQGRLMADLHALPGVSDAHHLHLWQIDERRVALSVHVRARDAQVILQAKAMLRERHGIAHSTIEFEPEGAPCADQDGGAAG